MACLNGFYASRNVHSVPVGDRKRFYASVPYRYPLWGGTGGTHRSGWTDET